jgi:catechol-2,3-dioxygenase
MRTELLYKETSLYVNDLEAVERFYRNIIGLMVSQRVKDQYSIFLHDDSTLKLYQTHESIEQDSTTSESFNLGQVTFGISPSDIPFWREHLHKHDVSIEEENIWPNGAQSICFRDPAGNRIKFKTQIRDFQDKEKEEQVRLGSPGGFTAKWKIYHAAKIGGQSDSTSATEPAHAIKPKIDT